MSVKQKKMERGGEKEADENGSEEAVPHIASDFVHHHDRDG